MLPNGTLPQKQKGEFDEKIKKKKENQIITII